MTMVNPRRDKADEDAKAARQFVEAALDYNSHLQRQHGSERLIAAAQVYATLATRG